jgi:hypothetical protein
MTRRLYRGIGNARVTRLGQSDFIKGTYLHQTRGYDGFACVGILHWHPEQYAEKREGSLEANHSENPLPEEKGPGQVLRAAIYFFNGSAINYDDIAVEFGI